MGEEKQCYNQQMPMSRDLPKSHNRYSKAWAVSKQPQGYLAQTKLYNNSIKSRARRMLMSCIGVKIMYSFRSY